MSAYDDTETAEVIEDYQNALDGLTMNSRYEIINLTQIARENTNFAHPISETLQEHIKKAVPLRKLPALYVLDSIVKNIGTPYTLFFGKNLYQTFMESYAAVDGATRRKMEEMLKTWKEPVPGSIDRSPVFPPEVVRPIENALIKFKTTAFEAQQRDLRSQQQLLGRPGGRTSATPYRQTPTPPGARPGAHQAGPYNQPPYPPVNGNQHLAAMGRQPYPQQYQNPQYPPQSAPQPTGSANAASPYQPPPAQGRYGAPGPRPGISIDSLNGDIQQLIVATRAEFARSPYDASIQQRLKGLLDLQVLLQSQNLPQDQLVLVKNQVDELAVKIRAPNAPPLTFTPTPSTPVPAFQPPMLSQPVAAPPPVAPVSTATAPVSLDSLLGKGALAALLSRAQSVTPQVSTPQPPPPALPAAIRSPAPQQATPQVPATSQPPNPMALLASLRSAGIILPPTPAMSAAPAPVPVPPPAAAAPPIIPPNIADILASARALVPQRPPPMDPMTVTADLQLKTASLKQYRPHLLPSLYEYLGPPCTQCGRRFRTDEDGRKKKTAHMDWHFRVHQRIAESEKRGQHRSWYVDQADWVKSRETIDLDHIPTAEEEAKATEQAGGAAARKPAAQWMPVPDDGDGTNTVCPVCQERFETKWLDEAQEWVWTDAVRVGARAYHASCYAEASKDGGGGGGTPMYGRATPEPAVLAGRKKRKAAEGASVDLSGLPLHSKRRLS